MSGKSTIGAQLYTLRDHLKTPPDIARTLRRVRQIGYEAVQVSGLGPIDPKELAKILSGEGLTCAVTHVALDMMKDTQRCVDYHHQLGCRYTALGWFAPEKNEEAAAAYRRFVIEYAGIVAPLARQGVEAGYHNHSHELIHYGGKPGMLVMIETAEGAAVPPVVIADPIAPKSQYLLGDLGAPRPMAPPTAQKHTCAIPWFEIDTYWIAHGGGDPAAWIERVAGRIPCVHFKDMSIAPGGVQKMSEIGAGNLNWPRIIQACRNAGVRWYLIERDQGDLDPFDSLQVSLMNMKAMGVP